MGTDDESLGLIAMIGVPVLLLASVVALHALPCQVLTILTAWILASLPIGVLVGHCVLSEE
jgi:hypothetical protein